MGNVLRLLSCESGWCLVQTPNRYISYVEKSSIQLMTPDEYQQWLEQAVTMVSTPHAWIYKSPNDRSEVLTDVVAGCMLICDQKKVNGFSSVAVT